MKPMMGEIIVFNGDTPLKGKIKNSRIIKPYLFIKRSASTASLSGKSPKNIFPPSKG